MTHRRTDRRSNDHRRGLPRDRLRRRLAAADDVASLEAYQRDLEQEAADVAQRIRALRAEAS